MHNNISPMKSIQKPIVIVGAGFAGMTFALNLKKLNPSLPILVVDSETNFIFKPLMYEVLSKEIRSWEATPKFANIFSDAITVIDTSPSMFWREYNTQNFKDKLPINVALSIAILISHSSKSFKDKIINFSDNPKFYTIPSNIVPLIGTVNDILRINSNSKFDISKTLNLFKDSIPEIIFIITDVEFNREILTEIKKITNNTA